MDNLVFSNMLHRTARTLVSVLGIAIGVLLIVFTIGLANGTMRERATREANVGAEIMFRASGTFGLQGAESFRLPIMMTETLAKIEGVKAAVPLGQTSVGADTNTGSRLIDGVNFKEYAEMARLKIIEGRAIETGDEAMIDTGFQRQKKFKIGDTVNMWERDFKIVGTYEPAAGGRIKIPLPVMQEQLGGENNSSGILVAVANPAEQETVAKRIREHFPTDQIIFTRDLPELYAASVPALNIFVKVVVAIAAAISMLVILLAMYTTVTERTRQIGILKALGMSNRTIAWVIEKEAILVSLIGVTTGILLTLLLRFAVMRTTSLVVEIEPQWIMVAFGVGLVGGTIGALYPALRAARQDAVEALGYE